MSGSTGKIMSDLDGVLRKNDLESYMLCGYRPYGGIPKNLYIVDKGDPDIAIRRNLLKSRITGRMGFDHKVATIKALDWVNEIQPDIIHLHNIHGNWINIKILFDYLVTNNIRVVWTLHDCWSFTGRCSHFEQCKCNKWQNQCYKCKNKNVYPITYFFDWSKKMYEEKKKTFLKIEDLTLVTPSKWLASYVNESFLKEKKVKTIHNGIDVNQYSPIINNRSIISEKVREKRVILGVASTWNYYKGFSDFIKLDGKIDHTKYVIVMVGLNSRQMKVIPDSIIGIQRTNNLEDLISIYSNAYVFLNMTYQDNYPTTNLEALSCGTPVITYLTGGSQESIIGDVGKVIKQGDIDGVLKVLDSIEMISRELCRMTAVKNFNKYDRYKEYIDIYKNA